MHTNYGTKEPIFYQFLYALQLRHVSHTTIPVLLGYYHSMRALMDSKVPTSIERPESLMSSQTSIAGTLLELIRRPISLLASTEYDSAFK